MLTFWFLKSSHSCLEFDNNRSFSLMLISWFLKSSHSYLEFDNNRSFSLMLTSWFLKSSHSYLEFETPICLKFLWTFPIHSNNKHHGILDGWKLSNKSPWIICKMLVTWGFSFGDKCHHTCTKAFLGGNTKTHPPNKEKLKKPKMGKLFYIFYFKYFYNYKKNSHVY